MFYKKIIGDIMELADDYLKMLKLSASKIDIRFYVCFPIQ